MNSKPERNGASVSTFFTLPTAHGCRRCSVKSVFLSIALGVLAAGSAFGSSVCVNDRECVPAGFDYFVAQTGTSFAIAGVQVNLVGIPDASHSGADTIVQRLGNIDVADVPGSTETVDTQLVALNLTGVDSACPQGVGACNVTINLDPNHPSLGNLVFLQTVKGEATVDPSCSTGTAAGLPCEGTFTSFFDVFFDLSFTTLNGQPLPCDTAGDTKCLQPDLILNGSGSWTDDNGGLFIAGGQVSESNSTAGGVYDGKVVTPEPGTLVLFGTALGLAGLLTIRQVRAD